MESLLSYTDWDKIISAPWGCFFLRMGQSEHWCKNLQRLKVNEPLLKAKQMPVDLELLANYSVLVPDSFVLDPELNGN